MIYPDRKTGCPVSEILPQKSGILICIGFTVIDVVMKYDAVTAIRKAVSVMLGQLGYGGPAARF